MHIGAIIIGDEILSGRRQDRHFPHIVEVLGGRGLQLAWARYVGDDLVLLTQQFRDIRVSGHVCISFGGIGATPDDCTRQAMAAAHGVGLARHPEAVRIIEERFGSRAYPNRILMAELPAGASIIPNPYNRIPGFTLGRIHCVPGFPEMAWPMLEWVLSSHYPALRGPRPAQYSVLLPGAQESELIEMMSVVGAHHPQVRVSSLPRFLPEGGRLVELGTRGPEAEAAAAMEEIKALLRAKGQVVSEPGPE